MSTQPQPQQNNNQQSPQATAKSGLVIGGPMKCFLHFDKNGENYTTDNIDEWNKHCHDTGHTLSGTRKCEDCDNLIVYHNHPYRNMTPTGLALVLRCDECNTKLQQQEQQVKTSKAIVKTVGKYKANSFSDNPNSQLTPQQPTNQSNK